MPHLPDGGYWDDMSNFIGTKFGQNRAAHMFSQSLTPCEFFEAQYFRCIAAFGYPMARLHCDLEYRDLNECVFREKELKRFIKIRETRWKKFANGELDRPFVKNFPEVGDFQPDYYKYNHKA